MVSKLNFFHSSKLYGWLMSNATLKLPFLLPRSLGSNSVILRSQGARTNGPVFHCELNTFGQFVDSGSYVTPVFDGISRALATVCLFPLE